MGTAAKILAQATPQVQVSSPGVRAPVLVTLLATVAGGGVVTVVSATDANGLPGTTDGVSIVLSSGGIYDITFPACRSFVQLNEPVVIPNVLATVTEARKCAIDKTAANTSAKTGKLRFNTATLAGAVSAPVSGSIITWSAWLDLS